MSRIHEALKRAEREKGRGIAQAPPRESAAEPAAAAAAPAVAAPAAVSAPAPSPAVAVAAAGPAPQPVAAVAPAEGVAPALLESCRRPHWHEDSAKLYFLAGKGNSFATEQLRTLRSRLYQARETRPLKKVLVTSAMPGEGKTFVCANLAYAFERQTDRRVLLVDADLRAPGLHSLLGAPAEPGLASYLQGAVGVEKILQRGPHENFYLIPAGKPAANPADLLAGGKLKGLLAQLAPLFDWILLDSPAAGPVSDALRIADWCDGVLLVVQGGKTPYDLAQGVTRELREKRLLGVVLNRTELPTAAAN
jgi:protein-tyrosine kinase